MRYVTYHLHFIGEIPKCQACGFVHSIFIHSHQSLQRQKLHFPDFLAARVLGVNQVPKGDDTQVRHGDIEGRSEADTPFPFLTISVGKEMMALWHHATGSIHSHLSVQRLGGQQQVLDPGRVLGLASQVGGPSYVKFCSHSWTTLGQPRTCFFNPSNAFLSA